MEIDRGVVGKSSGPVTRSWTSTDALVYALGVGAGSLDPSGFELDLTTENSAGVRQRVLPTFAAIIGGGGSLGGVLREAIGGVDPARIVHGEQAIELFSEIPAEGSVRTTSTVTGVFDKGSGALVTHESISEDAGDGRPLFKSTSGLFVRGAGGFGGERSQRSAAPMPARDPDEVVAYTTRPDQALLYRLSGDRNPLHSDPEFAKRAGFDRPILHGLCTFGFTGRAILHTLCGSDPGRLRSMSARFSAPTYPGDTLTVQLWADGRAVRFRTHDGRGRVVLDRGTATVGPAS